MEFSTKPLADLTKFFNNEENKDTGEMYHILNSKIFVFYDCYQKVGLLPERYHEGLSMMLKGRAARFSYGTLSSFDFSTMIAKLRPISRQKKPDNTTCQNREKPSSRESMQLIQLKTSWIASQYSLINSNILKENW
jgi:hypothetical protein